MVWKSDVKGVEKDMVVGQKWKVMRSGGRKSEMGNQNVVGDSNWLGEYCGAIGLVDEDYSWRWLIADLKHGAI